MKRSVTSTAVICLGVLFFLIVDESHGDEVGTSSADHPDQAAGITIVTSSPLVLGDECPEWLDDSVRSDTKCLDAIEGYLLDKAVYTLRFPGMLPKQASFTFRTMFDSYEKDKKLATDALVDQECQLLSGPMRMDLRDRCNAKALFRYGEYVFSCYAAREMNWFVPGPVFQGKSRYQKYSGGIEELERAREEGDERLEQYYSNRNGLREHVLRDIWLESRGWCPIDSHLPQEWTKAHQDLKEIVARLGDEKTLFQPLGGGIGPGFGDEAYWKSKRELYPWQGHMITAIGGGGTAFPTTDPTLAIISAARGILGMRKAGYEPAIEEIVKDLCGNSNLAGLDIASDCATAYQNAKLQLDPIDLQEFHALDEIKETALKLDLYQSH